MQEQEVGRSETVWDNSDPQFVKQMEVNFYFEESQQMVIKAYDMDDEKNASNLSKQDFIGAVEFQLSEIVNSLDQVKTYKIKNANKTYTDMIVSAEEKVHKQSETILLSLGSDQSGTGYFFIIWKFMGPG